MHLQTWTWWWWINILIWMTYRLSWIFINMKLLKHHPLTAVRYKFPSHFYWVFFQTSLHIYNLVVVMNRQWDMHSFYYFNVAGSCFKPIETLNYALRIEIDRFVYLAYYSINDLLYVLILSIYQRWLLASVNI